MAIKRSGAKVVVSGEVQIGKRKANPKPKAKAKKKSGPRPKNPLEENRAEPNPQPESASLFPPGVATLFQMPTPNQPGRETDEPEEKQTEESPSINDSSNGEANEDVQRRLDSIPDVIGGTAVEETEEEPEISSDEIRSLMIEISFEEQDVAEFLAESFDWLSQIMGSDHWKLTERQVRMLKGPTQRLLTSMWAKLLDRLPEAVVRWCENTPGAAAFLVTFGIVVAPKAMEQIAIRKERKQSKTIDAPQKTPHQPAKQEPSGMGGIPVATGIVGAAN